MLVNLRTDQLQRNPILAISNQVKRKAHVSRSQRPGRSHPVDKTVYRISISPHDIHSITACAQHILFTPVFSTGRVHVHHGGLERGVASMANTEQNRIPGQRSRDIDRFTSETCGLTQKIRMLKSAPWRPDRHSRPGRGDGRISRSLRHRLIQSLLVAGRSGRPRFRARLQGQGYPCRQHEASWCLRPGGRKQAQGRTGDTPSRSGPASHRAQSHAPYTTRPDQEEHERPSPLCP